MSYIPNDTYVWKYDSSARSNVMVHDSSVPAFRYQPPAMTNEQIIVLTNAINNFCSGVWDFIRSMFE